MTISRRTFLTASAGLALTPMFGGPTRAVPVPREADVVVVGAGAAGIAAARRIMAANRKVIVIEASGLVGGRCQTDSTSFAVPFDRGGRWLHNPDINPMIRLARSVGLDIAPAAPGQRIRVGRRNARAGETEDFLATLVRANRAIDEASRGKADIACAAALPTDLGIWADTVEFVLGPYASGKDLKELSAMDQVRAQDRSALIACRQGLGTLIGRLAESVPVALSTPATRIVWSGRDASVETPAGTISARAVIVTVSTNVLSSGAIKFTPDLPKRQVDAAAKLGLGSYDRIALQFAGDPLGISKDEMMIEQSAGRRTALLFAKIGGSSLSTIDVAGSFGRELSAQGEPAMRAFAAEWITKLFGSDAAKAIERSSATRWNAAPFVRGAISAAVPGGQPSRRVLMEPLGGLFLAGEAAHETLWGTVDGAWDSGERTAEAVLKRLEARKSDAPAEPRRRRRAPRQRSRSRNRPSANGAPFD